MTSRRDMALEAFALPLGVAGRDLKDRPAFGKVQGDLRASPLCQSVASTFTEPPWIG